MIFYNFLWKGYYGILKSINNPTPRSTAVLLTFVAFIVHIFMVIVMVKEITGTLLLPLFESKYYFLIVLIPVLILTILYFHTKRMDLLVHKYEESNSSKKNLSVFFAVILLIIPIIIIAVLSKK